MIWTIFGWGYKHPSHARFAPKTVTQPPLFNCMQQNYSRSRPRRSRGYLPWVRRMARQARHRLWFGRGARVPLRCVCVCDVICDVMWAWFDVFVIYCVSLFVMCCLFLFCSHVCLVLSSLLLSFLCWLVNSFLSLSFSLLRSFISYLYLICFIIIVSFFFMLDRFLFIWLFFICSPFR